MFVLFFYITVEGQKSIRRRDFVGIACPTVRICSAVQLEYNSSVTRQTWFREETTVFREGKLLQQQYHFYNYFFKFCTRNKTREEVEVQTEVHHHALC